MTISARVICDSIYEGGPRLTTFVLRYPRFIHSELMTHRVFSRNAASSRAIPIQKMIQAVKDDPAIPVWWGKNRAGMQAKEELSDEVEYFNGPDGYRTSLGSPRSRVLREWLRARNDAIWHVEQMMEDNLHKQIANRILEPWAHIEVVLTGTEWTNFYALRNHPDAQPEFQDLARKMLAAHNDSQPQVLTCGQFHLPFIVDADYVRVHDVGPAHPGHEDSLWWAKISAARCARVSYLKHDGEPASFEEDLALYDKLMGGTPKHASPTEHQARVPTAHDYWPPPDEELRYPSNLRGWVQFRKLVAGENVDRYEGLRNV